MGVHVVKVPDIGEGIAEVEVVEWHVQPGDTVVADQVLAEVMTDKAAVEVPSPTAGRVLELGGPAGAKLAVGGVLIRLDADGAAAGRCRRGAGFRRRRGRPDRGPVGCRRSRTDRGAIAPASPRQRPRQPASRSPRPRSAATRANWGSISTGCAAADRTDGSSTTTSSGTLPPRRRCRAGPHATPSATARKRCP